MSHSSITIHCRVRNEERFVRSALLSVLPIAEKILVYDTGSTDRTLEEIASIGSDKIEVVCKPFSDARGIMEYRNEMIERTRTEWFFQVDGDELYPQRAAERILEEIKRVPPHVHRIVLYRRHFVENLNLITSLDHLGRIYRTREVRWRLFDPQVNEVGHETPYLIKNPSAPLEAFSKEFPRDIYFFHCHHLIRSSKDRDLGSIRRWRTASFPVNLYFGPWPEVLSRERVFQKGSLDLLIRLILVNLKVLGFTAMGFLLRVVRKLFGRKVLSWVR